MQNIEHLKPLVKMGADCARLTPEDLRQPFHVQSLPRELKPIARSLNALLNRMEMSKHEM